MIDRNVNRWYIGIQIDDKLKGTQKDYIWLEFFDFLFPISFQPDGASLWLYDFEEFIFFYQRSTRSGCQDIRFWKN